MGCKHIIWFVNSLVRSLPLQWILLQIVAITTLKRNDIQNIIAPQALSAANHKMYNDNLLPSRTANRDIPSSQLHKSERGEKNARKKLGLRVDPSKGSVACLAEEKCAKRAGELFNSTVSSWYGDSQPFRSVTLLFDVCKEGHKNDPGLTKAVRIVGLL